MLQRKPGRTAYGSPGGGTPAPWRPAGPPAGAARGWTPAPRTARGPPQRRSQRSRVDLGGGAGEGGCTLPSSFRRGGKLDPRKTVQKKAHKSTQKKTAKIAKKLPESKHTHTHTPLHPPRSAPPARESLRPRLRFRMCQLNASEEPSAAQFVGGGARRSKAWTHTRGDRRRRRLCTQGTALNAARLWRAFRQMKEEKATLAAWAPRNTPFAAVDVNSASDGGHRHAATKKKPPQR